jgi:methylmalonyl-CoA mutase, N-terminal domain
MEKDSKYNIATNSGITVDEVYTPAHLAEAGFDYEEDLGKPGAYPFTRGITPAMYRDNPWLMAQYSGFGNAEDANQRFKELLRKGTTALNVALDLPTQLGYDSDHSLAGGEVGKIGVAIDSLRDIEDLFEGISLSKIKNISCIANAISPVMLSMFIALGEKQGLSPKDYTVYLQNDILKEFGARGAYIFPPLPSVKLAVDVLEYCTRYFPNYNTISFCGYHFREAGCNAFQELAFTFANAIAYTEEAIKRGLGIDSFARTYTVFLGSGIEILEEAAKFRAARRVWARILKERFDSRDAESLKLRIRAYTCGSNLTRQQPLNNIARATLEALAAILGGVQLLVVSSMDEAYAIPTEESQSVALRTQQILYHESGVTKTVDPLGGSYYVESLTKDIEKRTWDYLNRILSMGGAVRALESGFIQEELASSAYHQQRRIEGEEQIIVGVNRYRQDGEGELKNVFRVDPESEKRQVERLNELRRERDNKVVKEKLEAVRRSAVNGENMVFPALAAVREYATIGEICGQLRDVYGEAMMAGFF